MVLVVLCIDGYGQNLHWITFKQIEEEKKFFHYWTYLENSYEEQWLSTLFEPSPGRI